MSAREAFLRLTGGTLVHLTPAANRESIARHGLRSPESLARLAGVAPESLLLRRDRREIRGDGWRAVLNHQRPLLAGRRAAFLEGHDLESWSAQLDRRIFFWPGRSGAAFGRSLDAEGPMIACVLEAGALFDAMAARVDLAPINTGNATRRPAPRGDAIYVPADAADRFRGARGRSDRLAEVSLRADLPPDLLERICVAP